MCVQYSGARVGYKRNLSQMLVAWTQCVFTDGRLQMDHCRFVTRDEEENEKQNWAMPIPHVIRNCIFTRCDRPRYAAKNKYRLLVELHEIVIAFIYYYPSRSRLHFIYNPHISALVLRILRCLPLTFYFSFFHKLHPHAQREMPLRMGCACVSVWF